MGNKPSSSGVVIEVTKYAIEENDESKTGEKQERLVLPELSTKVLDKYAFSLNSSCMFCSIRLPGYGERPAPQDYLYPE